MPHCQLEVTGSDGRVERLEVEATSVFDAGPVKRMEADEEWTISGS
jgi:hypothetical protein